MGTRYSTLPDHPATPPRVHLLVGWLGHDTLPHGHVPASNMAVGLRSVDQLTLSAQIWENRGMTEVYNLATAGNADDHKLIPGTK